MPCPGVSSGLYIAQGHCCVLLIPEPPQAQGESEHCRRDAKGNNISQRVKIRPQWGMTTEPPGDQAVQNVANQCKGKKNKDKPKIRGMVSRGLIEA